MAAGREDEDVTFSPEQLAERRKSIGASDAGAIMAGEWAKLWQIQKIQLLCHLSPWMNRVFL